MSDKFRVTLSDGTVCVFYYWSRENEIVVTQPSIQAGSEFRLISIVSGLSGGQFDELAALFPYHPRTPEEQARLDAMKMARTHYENRTALTNALRGISGLVDNPSHWNRLAPEIKSAMQTHYREVLKIREHENFEKAKCWRWSPVRRGGHEYGGRA